MLAPSLTSALLRVLAARIDRVPEWIASVPVADVDTFCTAYTAAARRVGRGPLAPTDDERVLLQAAAPEAHVDRWSVADAARAVLLLSAAQSLDLPAFQTLAVACVDRGDAREQESWMRAVAWMPAAERFLPIVIDACRTNIVPLFESIACENPYPATYFPERNFNQMVLKAFFNHLAIARIIGLRDRMNPELARMASDYAAERRAAGRSVPPDLALASPNAGQADRTR
jgi:hypothetical protein